MEVKCICNFYLRHFILNVAVNAITWTTKLNMVGKFNAYFLFCFIFKNRMIFKNLYLWIPHWNRCTYFQNKRPHRWTSAYQHLLVLGALSKMCGCKLSAEHLVQLTDTCVINCLVRVNMSWYKHEGCRNVSLSIDSI